MRRTNIQDFRRIEQADDLERVVKDKRKNKRASRQKAKRRNRHYENKLLKEYRKNYEQEKD